MTMDISQVLEVLGTKRVIWIDDRFNATPAQLAILLTNNLEITQACKIPELSEALASYEFDATATVQMVTQILTDLTSQRIEEIHTAFFTAEKAQKTSSANELTADAIARVCLLLGVTDSDKWTFEKADNDLPSLCTEGDADISYIVDLNDSNGSSDRGLDILRTLWCNQSKGTAFILTHEANMSREVETEQKLREKLDLDGLGLPVCVIAKERLSDEAGDDAAMTEALRVGVKRAGLRQSMHQVLASARGELQSAIDEAALSLLTIPPEQLEEHVFERGYKEGVSELHVVERAITAYLGKKSREFFGINSQVQSSVQRLRTLRGITLQETKTEPDPQLAAFREAEVWESDALLNKALTPIACGDVFEVDGDEDSTNGNKQKFILLGQPCDISLRPEDKERVQDTAFLVPLKTKANKPASARPDAKEPLLPFTLNGVQWACDFRNVSIVRLSILDLATFRPDGKVRVDDGHEMPTGLLIAQQKVYNDRTKPATDALNDPSLRPDDKQVSVPLQLTFSTADAFKYIFTPVFEDASKKKINHVTYYRPKRATWRLRRCGRVRMPYAAALLDFYTSVVSRHAFDLDFMSPGLDTSAGDMKAADPSDCQTASKSIHVSASKFDKGWWDWLWRFLNR